MFERVLFPTDFSDRSQKVLECIKELPGLKKVVLLHVIDPGDFPEKIWDPGGRIDEASAKLNWQRSLLEKGNFEIKTRVTIAEESISRAIQRVADETDSSVVVMGTRGKGVIKSIFLGSVAKDVLRNGNTNLLLLRYGMFDGTSDQAHDRKCSQIFSRVICPSDLSKSSEEAIAFARCLPGVEEIMLHHVVFCGDTWEEVESRIEEAVGRLNAIGNGLKSSGIKVEVRTSTGNPAEEIIALAKKEDASMIALSSHGKDWLKQLVIGSTAYEVARMADQPILIIRSGGECKI